jgi:predicted transcriptional regulator of viral defense system
MEIRKALNLPTTFPAGPEIIEHLSAMGLASPLSVELPKKSPHASPSKEFVLFGIQESHEIDPLEILQSYNQKGVICYFSALTYFDLTTQVPTHQHVATLTRPTQHASLRERESAPPASISDGPKRSKLGTQIFSYDGVPYFSVKRSATSVPGIQTRVISSRSNIRITTKEQTLLDTLHYPIHCGGMEVTFEAWNLSKKNINYDSICDYLARIQTDPLIRRLGAILDLLDCVPTRNLSLFLEQSRKRIFSLLDVPYIPLLRGIDFHKLDTNWKVLIP